MSTHTIIVILLVLLVLGSFPAYPYSRNWGYAPFGSLAGILVLLLVLRLLGVI